MTEQILFEKLKIKLIPDLEKTSDEYSRWDCTSKKYKLKVELKCRKKHYEQMMIEKSKYDALIQHPNNRYICSTPQGVYSWNLHTITTTDVLTWELPTTTAFNNNADVNKQLILLDISEATNITKLLNG